MQTSLFVNAASSASLAPSVRPLQNRTVGSKAGPAHHARPQMSMMNGAKFNNRGVNMAAFKGQQQPTMSMWSAAPSLSTSNKYQGAPARSSGVSMMAAAKPITMLGGASNNYARLGASAKSGFISGFSSKKPLFSSFAVSTGSLNKQVAMRASTVMSASAGPWDQETVDKLESASKLQRLTHLEEQAMDAIRQAVESGAKVVFPNALIAGDVVMTHLISRLEMFDKIPILAVNTLHLFEESLDFLEEMEKHYDFEAKIFMAEGITGDRHEAKKQFDKKYGADLWKLDIERYDQVCKVEPFIRGLKDLDCEIMITGRTRWQGNERAWIDIYEAPKKEGGRGNVNPIAHWTLEDTFNYIAHYKIPHHPLHAKGYPSIGDAKDTIPIPEDQSVKFEDFKFVGDKAEWLGYALERKGRFVGLANKDGSTKTECGIHVDGAEKTFDRDLWESDAVINLDTEEAALTFKKDSEGLMVVYAPWCQFCQGMEDEFQKYAEKFPDVKVAKYRGDVNREFSEKEFEVKSFPTVLAVKDGKITKYESEDRVVAEFEKFVAAN